MDQTRCSRSLLLSFGHGDGTETSETCLLGYFKPGMTILFLLHIISALLMRGYTSLTASFLSPRVKSTLCSPAEQTQVLHLIFTKSWSGGPPNHLWLLLEKHHQMLGHLLSNTSGMTLEDVTCAEWKRTEHRALSHPSPHIHFSCLNFVECSTLDCPKAISEPHLMFGYSSLFKGHIINS